MAFDVTPGWASEALARAYGAERWEELGGWVLRSSPASSRKRGNSALPLEVQPQPAMLDELAIDLVQVEPLEERAELDAWLAAEGWALAAPSLVLVASGEAASRCTDAAVSQVRRDGERLSAAGGEATLALLPDGHVAVFALEVEPSMRRRGLGRALLAAAGTVAGDGSVLVQVEAGNAPARAFYAAAGFRVLHRYHYRRRTSPRSTHR